MDGNGLYKWPDGRIDKGIWKDGELIYCSDPSNNKVIRINEELHRQEQMREEKEQSHKKQYSI